MPDHRKVFSGYAQNLGLNVAQFENDIIGDRANARVAADMKRGSSLGIGGTPSVFLNGRPLLPEEMTTNRMRQLIDAELQNKK